MDRPAETVVVDGVQCYTRACGPGFVAARKRLGHADVCPMCRKRFGPEDEIYLILTNFKLFPNTMCHIACMDAHGKEGAIRLMAADYREAKTALAKAAERMKPWR